MSEPVRNPDGLDPRTEEIRARLAARTYTRADLAYLLDRNKALEEENAALLASLETLRDQWRSAADEAFAAYPNPIGTRDGFPRGYASAQSVHATDLDTLIEGARG